MPRPWERASSCPEPGRGRAPGRMPHWQMRSVGSSQVRAHPYTPVHPNARDRAREIPANDVTCPAKVASGSPFRGDAGMPAQQTPAKFWRAWRADQRRKSSGIKRPVMKRAAR